jgi:branched-chain amino acid transport system permease protein/neutral amino acid transport system permease protein
VDLIDFLQLLVYGLVLGGILSVGAIGASLLFGILRFSNFAQGDLMTFGAYCALAAMTGLGLSVWAALPFAIAGGAIAAALADRLVYRRLRRTQPVILLIASFATALILRSLVMLIWGVQDRSLVKGIHLPWRIEGVAVRPDHLAIVAASLGLVVALHLFLTYSRTGRAMRAMSDNMDLARVTGIDAERVILWTWLIGGGLAGAAGLFLALDSRLTPMMGWQTLLPIFAGAILGGYGSLGGAVLGGMAIGIASELSTAVLDPAYKPAIAFVIMILMLVVRPTGLVGARR